MLELPDPLELLELLEPLEFGAFEKLPDFVPPEDEPEEDFGVLKLPDLKPPEDALDPLPVAYTTD